MGVPRLATYLSPFAVLTVLGCERKDCERHPRDTNCTSHVIIDGPSFAYVLYDRLITNKPTESDALSAIPSYSEIGKATLRILGELEKCGLIMYEILSPFFYPYADKRTTRDHVYFDGFLPPQKENTRISRSETLLRTLFSSQTSQPNGFRNIVNQSSLDKRVKFKKLYKRTSSQSNFRGLPPPPFLVPAVIEALANSKYASITDVVPGEADGYCAQAARQNGGTTLTNDSDLLVYDLGPEGAVGSLHALTIVENEEKKRNGNDKTHRWVQTTILKPSKVAHKLGLENLYALAYAMRSTTQASLFEAVKHARALGLSQAELNEHLAEYITPPSTFAAQQCPPATLCHLESYPHALDPRLSEMILQAHTNTPCMHLPILIEDPTRMSAFTSSTSLRQFVYSIAVSPQGFKGQQITEYQRKGSNVLPNTLAVLSGRVIITYANQLYESLQRVKTEFSCFSLSNAFIYRIHALYELYTWHLDTAHTPPTRDAMSSILIGKTQGAISWDIIHLTAQIEGGLYSLRMLKQTLDFCLPLLDDMARAHEPGLLETLDKLKIDLANLPGLAELLPNRAELTEKSKRADVDAVLDQLALLLWQEAERDENADGGPEIKGMNHDDIEEMQGDGDGREGNGAEDLVNGGGGAAILKKKRKKTKRKKR